MGLPTPIENPPGVTPPGILQNHQPQTNQDAQPGGDVLRGSGVSSALGPFSAPPLDLGLPHSAGNPNSSLKELLQNAQGPAPGPSGGLDGNQNLQEAQRQ